MFTTAGAPAMARILSASALGASILLGATTTAPALAASATGTASARIVQVLAVETLAALRFGHVEPGGGDSAGGTVTIAADGTRRVQNMATGDGSGTHGPAMFRVTGEPGLSYRIALPRTVQADNAEGDQLAVVDLTAVTASLGAGLRGLLRGGHDEVRVGGSLVVPGGTAGGHYSADLQIHVAYE